MHALGQATERRSNVIGKAQPASTGLWAGFVTRAWCLVPRRPGSDVPCVEMIDNTECRTRLVDGQQPATAGTAKDPKDTQLLSSHLADQALQPHV